MLKEFSNGQKINLSQKKFKTKIFSLEPGDCLIHHSQIVHGSKKIFQIFQGGIYNTNNQKM